MKEFPGYKKVKDSLYGIQLEQRKFIDNMPTGKCWRCNNMPSSTEEHFLALILSAPICNNVELTSLLASHFDDQDDTLRMKCSDCCKSFKSNLQFGHSKLTECKQEGECSRAAFTQRSISYAPSTLFVLLKRFNNGPDGPKATTLVKTGSSIELQGHNYELVGVLDHLGETINSGHWVARLRSARDQWILYNDANVSSCKSVVSGDNVLLLFKLKPKQGSSTTFSSSLDYQQPMQFGPKYSFVGDAVNIVDIDSFLTVASEEIQPSDEKLEDEHHSAQENSEPETEEQANLLETTCRGCGKDMLRLLRHLVSNKGRKCMESYSMDEVEKHKGAVNRKKVAKYVSTNKEQVKETHRQEQAKYASKNKEQVKETNRKERAKYVSKNKEQVKESHRKEQAKYASKNKEKVKETNRKAVAKHRKNHKKKREDMTEWDGFRVFWAETAWGAIYSCISCHKTKFRNGVKKANIPKLECSKYYEKSVDPSHLGSKSKFHMKGSYWICHTCHDKIKGNSMPACSAMNSLKIFDRPACLELTEVENVLLAPRIGFMKMIKLPVSQMRGVRDRIVNVPITGNIIKQTVASLPRTYDEAGIIPISLRKKKNLLSSHRQQWVCPQKMALAYR